MNFSEHPNPGEKWNAPKPPLNGISGPFSKWEMKVHVKVGFRWFLTYRTIRAHYGSQIGVPGSQILLLFWEDNEYCPWGENCVLLLHKFCQEKEKTFKILLSEPTRNSVNFYFFIIKISFSWVPWCDACYALW